jgi:hypothetical protein
VLQKLTSKFLVEVMLSVTYEGFVRRITYLLYSALLEVERLNRNDENEDQQRQGAERAGFFDRDNQPGREQQNKIQRGRIKVLYSSTYKRNRLTSTALQCGRLQVETTEEYCAKL